MLLTQYVWKRVIEKYKYAERHMQVAYWSLIKLMYKVAMV